jgi:tetratricopeptide (TPR) repeat protein
MMLIRHHTARFCALSICAGLATFLAACSGGDALEEARSLQAQGRYEASLEPLAELLDSDANPEALFLYGLALSETNRSSQALWSLRQAMQSPEWLTPAGLLLAQNATRSGNNDHAIEVLTDILEVHPDHIGALELRAYAYVHTRRYFAEALEDTERILAIDPGALRVRNVQAAALLGLDRIEEAGAIIAELEQQALGPGGAEDDGGHPFSGNPDLAGLYCVSQAAFADAKGDGVAAAAAFDACLEQYPADASVLKAAVEFFDARGEGDKALKALEVALEASGDTRAVRIPYVLRLQAAGRDEDAEAVLRAATEKARARPWADLAGFLLERGDEGPALEAYERAAELEDGRDPSIAFSYAEALVAAGRLDEAEAVAEGLADAHRHLLVGRIHLERKDYASALASLSEGVRLWPNSAAARLYAAIAAERMGDFERAIEEYRYSIRSGPAETDARLRLAQLHASEGDYAAAYSILLHGGPSRAPHDFESVLLLTELSARLGMRARPIPQAFLRDPGKRALLVVAMARGVRAGHGSRLAVEAVRSHQLDLLDPAYAPALVSLTSDLVKLGEAERAVGLNREAIKKHPNSAVLHEALGKTLRDTGATEAARNAFERALELDSDRVGALVGLAGLDLEADALESAQRRYERAVKAEADSVEAGLGRAEVLRGLGRIPESEQALEELLEQQPYAGSAALRLAQSRAERRAEDTTRTLALARAAERFNAGPEASTLVRDLESVE